MMEAGAGELMTAALHKNSKVSWEGMEDVLLLFSLLRQLLQENRGHSPFLSLKRPAASTWKTAPGMQLDSLSEIL